MPHERPLLFQLNWMVQFLSGSPTSFPSQSWIFWKRLFTMFLASASKGRCSHVMKKTGNDIVTFFHIMFSICPFFFNVLLDPPCLDPGSNHPHLPSWTPLIVKLWLMACLCQWMGHLTEPLKIANHNWNIQEVPFFSDDLDYHVVWHVFCLFFWNYFCFQEYHRNNTLLLYDLHWFTVSPILYLLVLLYAHIHICIAIYMHICTVHTHVHWCNGGFRDNL